MVRLNLRGLVRSGPPVREKLEWSGEQGNSNHSNLVSAKTVLAWEGGGSTDIYRIRDHLSPYRRALPRFNVKQVGMNPFPLFVERKKETWRRSICCQMSLKSELDVSWMMMRKLAVWLGWWIINFKAFLALPGWVRVVNDEGTLIHIHSPDHSFSSSHQLHHSLTAISLYIPSYSTSLHQYPHSLPTPILLSSASLPILLPNFFFWCYQDSESEELFWRRTKGLAVFRPPLRY